MPRISAWVEKTAAKRAHLLDREALCRAPGDARPRRKLQAASARSSEGTSREICDTNTIQVCMICIEWSWPVLLPIRKQEFSFGGNTESYANAGPGEIVAVLLCHVLRRLCHRWTRATQQIRPARVDCVESKESNISYSGCKKARVGSCLPLNYQWFVRNGVRVERGREIRAFRMEGESSRTKITCSLARWTPLDSTSRNSFLSIAP